MKWWQLPTAAERRAEFDRLLGIAQVAWLVGIELSERRGEHSRAYLDHNRWSTKLRHELRDGVWALGSEADCYPSDLEQCRPIWDATARKLAARRRRKH